MQIQEFNDRFDEVNTELLGCIASLSPTNSFQEFDQLKVMRLSEFYPEDLSPIERITLEHQLAIPCEPRLLCSATIAKKKLIEKDVVIEVAVVADSYRSCWDEVAMGLIWPNNSQGLVEEQNKNCFKENNKHFLIVCKYTIQETMPEVESNSLRCMQKME
ncbi:unnamed protein product [Brassica napus]|uniref:(rape) hypothetical protein n=1 Tax=Brassica napus TaxID=3708 RepID=A0A816JIP2_BRANA|nr:unnamed protein product [Brassica napus]